MSHRGISSLAKLSPTAAMSVRVDAPNVAYTETDITSKYTYTENTINVDQNGRTQYVVTPKTKEMTFTTKNACRRTGVMIIGLGGNNGSTLMAAVLANKHNVTWETRRGTHKPNYFGSITMASTLRLGMDSKTGKDVFVPLRDVVPMVHPNEMPIGGWDVSGLNMADAMKRSGVLEYELQQKLRPMMADQKPLPAVYDPSFVAGNQEHRADNFLPVDMSLAEKVNTIRQNIRDFKAKNDLETVVLLWSASTERFMEEIPGVHDSAEGILSAIATNDKSLGAGEIAPSVIYAVAAMEEGCSFINGAPQNTLVPGLLDLAAKRGVFVGGDDFKSGQTKLKSALCDFMIKAGLKPECIASYNHLGNNDGRNLSEPEQFRPKEVSKSGVIDDMIRSNQILYPDPEKDAPDHCIVIKYLPFVGDSKKAMDEYTASIFMNGLQTFVVHTTCEDSLLAAPLIIDLVVLTELMGRVSVDVDGKNSPMDPVLHILSYLLKAPRATSGKFSDVINSLPRQRACIENTLRALIGLSPEHDLGLHKTIASLYE